MKFSLPQSLWSRTVLLVLFVAVVTQLLSLSLLTYYRQDLVRHEGTQLVRAYMAMTRSALRVMSPETLATTLAAEQADGTAIMLVQHPRADDSARLWMPAIYLLVEDLRREWGTDAIRLTLPPHQALLVRVQADWWMRIEIAPLAGHWPAGVALVVFFCTLVFSLVVGVFVGQLVQPLLQMERAAARFSRGEDAELPTQGPREIQRLADSLGRMMQELRRHERERHTMLAGLPHDLRAPLTRIRLRVSLLDPDTAPRFDNDLQAIEHITQQFLDYLRGLDAPSTLHLETFNLNELLAAVTDSYNSARKPVQLDMPNDTVTVTGDARQLRRAIDNLLDNAHHHGAPPVHMRLIRQRGTPTRLIVEDSGSGIPAGQRDKALRPFEQLQDGRRHQGQVGLGLAVVGAVAGAHGIAMALGQSDLGGLQVTLDLSVIVNPD